MHNVNIILNVISANPSDRQQFVLSSNDNKIMFPSFKLQKCNSLFDEIMNQISLMFADFPVDKYDSDSVRFIAINSKHTNHMYENTDYVLNIVYGIVLNGMYKTNNSFFWIPFSFSDILIPNELCIIGETIKYAF